MNSYYKELYKGQVQDQSNQEMTAREYSNTLLENYMKAIGAREQSIQQRKQQLSALPEQNNEVTFQNLNLRPMAAFVDSMTGSRLAQSYNQPMQMSRNEELRMKLENAVSKDEAGLLDDRLNVARLMNEDERVRERMATQSEDKDLDRALREKLFMMGLGDKQGAREQKAQAKASQEKLVPASAAENLADLRSQMNSVNKIKEEWNGMIGPVGGVADYLKKNLGSRVPNTQEAKYRSSLKQKAQTIGKALEGGKLTDVDYEKYIHFLPQPGDTEEMAQQRIDNLSDALQNAYNTRITSYNEVGYSTGTLPSMKSSPPQSARVRVSNGKEVLEIDRSDLADAVKDGYKEVK